MIPEKVVVTAADSGTRLLSMSKEMLPIFVKGVFSFREFFTVKAEKRRERILKELFKTMPHKLMR